MKFKDIKEGDVLVADGGFTCLKQDAECLVRKDDEGFYILCGQGSDAKHYLDGQEDSNGDLVGLSKLDQR